MNMLDMRKDFERTFVTGESALLHFSGVDGWDVYNCSIPFTWDGKRYMFGRVERRAEWMRSVVRLFTEVQQDEWALVENSMIYWLEDPYITKVKDEIVLGGTHVRLDCGKLDTYYGYFFRGQDLNELRYFTTGPDYMKDIRLVELADGRIGVFSRPRGEEVLKKYGSESMIGFTIIDSLEDLSPQIIAQAPLVDGLFGKAQWGGCNQAYLLDSGKIGVIGHGCYQETTEDGVVDIYMNTAFVLDPMTRVIENYKVIGTKECYPAAPAKKPHLVDCAFTSGIVMRAEGNADLYTGLGDTQEGRMVIPYPFEGFGKIVGSETV